MINDKKIVAVMPLKLNNERLPGKNTKILGDKPLLSYQLEMIQQIQEIDEIYVYCSDASIEEVLPAYVTFLKRPASLDLPTANFTEIFKTFSDAVKADVYVYVHATAPYVSLDTAQQCLDAVCCGDYDSAFCAVKIQDFLWKNNKPLNFDAENLPRSQDLEVIYRETSGVYVFDRDVFEKYHRRIGMKPYIKEVSFRESIDINTYEDFELAEIFLNK